MKIVKALFVSLLVTAAPPALADEAPDPPKKEGGCEGGQTELGLGLVAALAVMRRRSLTGERGKAPADRA